MATIIGTPGGDIRVGTAENDFITLFGMRTVVAVWV